MIRHNRAFSLTAAVLMAVLVSTTLVGADFCLWCDPKMTESFMNCMCSQIKINPIFEKMPSGALDDMKISMLAASAAIVRSRESMKMEMMTGAMAGELAELIKTGDSERAKLDLIEIVGYCYATTTRQSHYSFMQNVRKTVDFMLSKDEKPSYDDSVSETNSAPSQYPVQASSAAVARPPNNYYVPPLQPYFTTLIPNNFVSNQKYTQPQPKVSPYYSNARLPNSVQLAGGQGNVASLIYLPNKQYNEPYIRSGPNVQPQSTQTAASNSYSLKPNKWSNFAPATTVQQNRNLDVMPGQILPQNKELVSNVATSYAINDQRNIRNYVNGPVSNVAPSYANKDQRNRQNFVNGPVNNAAFRYVNNNKINPLNLITGPVNNAAPGYAKNDPRNEPNFITGPAVRKPSSAATSSTSVFTLNYQSLGANPLNAEPNQFLSQNKGPVTNAATSNGDNDKRVPPNFITNSGSQLPRSAATSVAEAFALEDESFPPYYSRNQIAQNSKSEVETLRQTRVYPLNHVNNSPNQLVQSTAGASSSNEPKPKYDYDSNYPPSSRDNHEPYGSKYPSQLSPSNKPPPNYANNSDNLKPVIPPDTASRDDSRSQPTNGKPAEVTNENNFPRSGDDGDTTRAMKFGETIYVKCAESRKFRSTFNKRTSNKKAASCIYIMVQKALKYCGYSKFVVEIAKACSDEIKSLPEKSTFEEYGEAMSKSLMDQFYKKDMIGENPEDQAICIIDAFLSRLKKKKSSRSSKSASSSTVTPYTESSSSDYSTTTGDRQDNSDDSENPYYYDSPTTTTDYNYGYNYYDNAQEGEKPQGDKYNGDYPTSQKNKRLKNRTSKKGQKNEYYTYQGRKDKTKKKKTNGRRGANDKPVSNNGSNFGSSDAGENQDDSETDPQQYTTLATYDTTSTQPQQGHYPDSTSKNGGGSSPSDAVLAPSQSQTNPDNEKKEKSNRVNILIEWAIKSIYDGKFNYKIYSNVIAALAKFRQSTHPELGSQKCFMDTLMEALTACTYLLSKVHPEFLYKITAPENTDEAVASWSRSSSEQSSPDSMQMSEKNKEQNGQSYDAQQIPTQKSYWNREYPTQQDNTYPPGNTKQGSRNVSSYSNSNAPPKDYY